jgi:RimJ/RimL family protein N-acetyltransferase
MRVTFSRLPDHQRGYALVERDDGVRYRLYGGRAGPQLPHDLRHLIVERELGITDGIWAGIAAGVVFASMRHVSGRRPPAAAEQSRELIRKFRAQGLRAELLADLVESVAVLDNPTVTQIRRLTGTKLAVLPDAEADPAAIAAAATAMQVEASRWARLRAGEELSYQWPPEPRRARTGGAHAVRLVRPDKRGNRPAVRAATPARGDIGLCRGPANRKHGAMEEWPDEVIEGGEVTLRRHRDDDLDALLQVVTDSADHLRPWMPWAEGYSRQSQAEFLAAAARDWQAGAAYNYVITTGGALVGGTGLMARIGPGGLEIGYWVRRGYTRRGLATAAAAALVEQAFRRRDIDRVEIVHDELNVASGGVPRKLGFTEVGRRRIEPPAAAGTGVGVVWRLVR